jgi:hypothetical protein
METKIWVTPELIVLVRSNPEEAVLTTCKWVGSVATSVETTFASCRRDIGTPCNEPCDVHAAS